jgi:hypothetical protein
MIKAAVVLTALLLTGANGDTRNAPLAAREVEIIGRDYAFTVPTELTPGRTAFRFTNKGKVIHEVRVALLRSGTTTQNVMALLNANQPLQPLIEAPVGILIARAGQRSSTRLATDLLADRDYLVICSFQDSDSAPMHSRMGMISVIHVSPGSVAASPSPRADTIIGIDYAFRVPSTLAPGPHRFVFINAGTVNHEVNIALLRPGVTVAQVFEIAKVNGSLLDLADEWIGVLSTRAGASPLGALEVTLLPGREYVLKCDLSNDAKAPLHVTLGMFASIGVAKSASAP